MSQIGPCPFCGEEDEIHALGGGGGLPYYVVCDNCAAYGPNADTEEEAVERWNARK